MMNRTSKRKCRKYNGRGDFQNKTEKIETDHDKCMMLGLLFIDRNYCSFNFHKIDQLQSSDSTYIPV